MNLIWKIIFSTLAFILFIFIAISLVNNWVFPDTNWDLSGEGEKIELNPELPIIQEFKASRDNLSRIRILFGRSYNKDGGAINLKLADENCKNIIREESFRRSAIQSEGYYDFKFSRVSDSKDRNFCLIINFEPEKEKYKKLNVFLSSNPVSESKISIGGEIKSGALMMRPAYKEDNFWENAKELNQRISQYKPWFLKNIFLYLLFFVLIFSTFLVLFILILLV